MSLSIYGAHRYGRCHTYFTEFWCSHVLNFIAHIGLSYLSPREFSLNYAVLLLEPESQSLNQHQLFRTAGHGGRREACISSFKTDGCSGFPDTKDFVEKG